MMHVTTGLDILSSDHHLYSEINGRVGYLCHAASVNASIKHGLDIMKSIFGERLIKVFSPQHGLFADVQDNMVESDHFFHEYYQVPVYSLYSDTRKPTDDMLEGLDHMIIDLQDIGTRVYTYIYTMTYMMEACAENDIQVIILDRPNPINGLNIEGNILDMKFHSFVGRHPLPMRHGMTIGEVAMMAQKHWNIDCNLRVIKMRGWKRAMNFYDTGLPWVLPSPNLPTVDGAFVFPGSVLFEGTNISEGRGTSRGLEIIGHPDFKNLSLHKKFDGFFKTHQLDGFVLRPMSFIPTFQKHQGTVCHGYQIHITDYKIFRPWTVGQVLCQKLFHHLDDKFEWKQPPYEYEDKLLPIDILNGTDQIRKWIENNDSVDELIELEHQNRDLFLEKRSKILIY